MLLNTEFPHIKIIGSLFVATCLWSSMAIAQALQCTSDITAPALKRICSDKFDAERQMLNNKYLTAYLITDAPVRLLQDTHLTWLNRMQQCKSNDCFKQQFELRMDDLDIYTSMNQSLTQHYLKYENGLIAKQPVHLQVHQLSKDRIKIEGIAYRNPNNRKETQNIAFLAYTTPENKQEIIDNEHDCKYSFNFQKALLTVSSQQKGCERFNGIYRLYD
ncbi:hypothetical protein C7E16_03020 [Acinetobacter radioresistens]|uniref:A1S_1983 family putative colistin resistance protein n=1 Tax=Acinetobacter radioresistens TaxID=40216 RepID=UPI000D0B9F51|nr:hypothetical protein [Acinetobacter radioresistens]PSD37343.1 hypothetical protein C7E16_03020 [Acinetobacter radioresistens]PSD38399.1 hypothetical protein C7E21_09620 [Acinetobacter radioresistens]